MGFWGNLADEAGKKTGKAIGNALFGKNAADQVIDVRGGISNDGSSGGSSQANFAQRIEAEGKSRLHTAEANAIEEETSRKQNEAARKAYEQCLNSLQQFYDSFNFDLTNSEEIEQKCLAIISWLDTVDWSAKEKASNFYCDGNIHKVNDTSKAKAEKLIKQLSLGVERLQAIGSDSSHLDFINSKLRFYLDRQAQELQRIAKRKSKIRKVLAIVGIVLVCGGAITGAILGVLSSLPNPKENGADCKEKVMELVEQNDLYNAGKVLLAYEGWKYDDSYKEASRYLVDKLLKADRVDEAIEINSQTGAGLHHSIGIHLIKKGLYNDAAGFFTLESNVVNNDIYYYTELCIIDMCEKGEISRARKFIKRRVADVYNPQHYLEKMNGIINSYL